MKRGMSMVLVLVIGGSMLSAAQAAPPDVGVYSNTASRWSDTRAAWAEQQLLDRLIQETASRRARARTVVPAVPPVTKAPPPPPLVTSKPAPPPRLPSRVDTVVRFALAQVGKPYVWAADGPGSYDCSGLVLAAYARIGVRLPHQSYAMLRHGRQVGRSQLRRGDLVWPQAGHVGIYLGDGRIVHAANRRSGVIVGPMHGFWTARRLL